MIRRSASIAMVAIVLSLLVHFFGIGFTTRLRPETPPQQTESDAVALGNTFEDLVETQAEPVEPEPAEAPEPEPEEVVEPEPEKAPEPEPEPEEVPEPEEAEVPTTDVQVASSNPQKTPVPDTGTSTVPRVDAAGPTQFDVGDVPEPETVQPAGGEDNEVSDAVSSPVESATVPEVAKGVQNGAADPAEAVAVEPTPSPTTEPSAEQLAALPAPVVPAAPVTPVAPTPEPSAVPVIPIAPEVEGAETQDTIVDPEGTQDTVSTDEEGDTDQTLLSSLRPRLPARRPDTAPEGQPDGVADTNTLSSRPRLIESPLTAYRRDGTDLTVRRNGGSQSGGSGSQNFRGTGNSDITNYAGRVFLHLNRAPSVHVSARGWTRVFFEINPDGSVGRIDIIDGTGSPEIERAAKAQIRAAEPLPRPPNGKLRRMNLFYRPG